MCVSQWVGEGGQRHINSYVTFKVEDAIKGKPGAQITLQMLGGTVGSEDDGGDRRAEMQGR